MTEIMQTGIQDEYRDFLFENIKKHYSSDSTSCDFYLTALLIKEALKYDPESSSLFAAMGNLFLRHGLFAEAYRFAERSFKIDGNELASRIISILKKPVLPLVGTIEITELCNIRCPFCNPRRSGRSNSMMPYDEFCHIWDRVKHFTKKLYLMGNGETFTHKDVYRILEYCKGPDIVIDTNGNVPLDFNRIIDSGIISLNFSVDGINQEMYEKYRRGGKLKYILDNISGLVNEKQKRNASFPIVTFKFIAFKHNEMYINQAYNLAKSIGCDSFRVEPCNFTCPENGLDMFREFAPLGPHYQRIGYIDFERREVTPLEERDNIACNVPFYSYMINVNGEIAPCCALATNDNLVSFGNIKEHTFEDIWNSTAYSDFRIMLLKDRWQEPKCRNCSAVPQPPYGKFLQDTNMEGKPYWHKEVKPTRYYPENNIISREEMTQLLNAGKTVEASYFTSIGKVEI